MSDLRVDDSDIDAARARIDAAAVPITGMCLGTDIVGSPAVASALAEVDSLIRTALDALSVAAGKAATDTSAIASTLDQTDQNLADGGS